eukprot:366058-Chlamydomonas_euryale.AAC.5
MLTQPHDESPRLMLSRIDAARGFRLAVTCTGTQRMPAGRPLRRRRQDGRAHRKGDSRWRTV